MLKALGKTISDVNDEMSDTKQTMAKTDDLNKVKKLLDQVQDINIKDVLADDVSSVEQASFTANDGVVTETKPNVHHRYDLLREQTKEDLIEVVNEHISKGWVPLGGAMLEPEVFGYRGKHYVQTIWLPNPDPLVLQQEDRIREK